MYEKHSKDARYGANNKTKSFYLQSSQSSENLPQTLGNVLYLEYTIQMAWPMACSLSKGSCFDKDREHSGHHHGHEEYFRRV